MSLRVAIQSCRRWSGLPSMERPAVDGAACRRWSGLPSMERPAVDGAACRRWSGLPSMERPAVDGAACRRWSGLPSMERPAVDGAACRRWSGLPSMERPAVDGAACRRWSGLPSMERPAVDGAACRRWSGLPSMERARRTVRAVEPSSRTESQTYFSFHVSCVAHSTSFVVFVCKACIAFRTDFQNARARVACAFYFFLCVTSRHVTSHVTSRHTSRHVTSRDFFVALFTGVQNAAAIPLHQFKYGFFMKRYLVVIFA